MRNITNASDGRVGPFPRMDGALAGWTNTMQFRKVTDTIVDYENVKTETVYPFEGVFQPMQSRDLYFKPEGQRNWKWWTLFTRTDYDISNGDIIEDFKGVRFKVIRSSDWGQAGFYRFDVLEDYTEHSI